MSETSEESVVLVSAIAHYSYCPRRCALIHVENQFDENLFTLRGSMAHARADEPTQTVEDGICVERALPIWSEKYGLYGKADVVEFNSDGTICPVEYKHGPKRQSEHDQLQLCAQALCLEEMFDCAVLRGAVYSSSSHARREVDITDELRRRTLDAVEQIRSMANAEEVPPPVNDARCPNCSLVNACMPDGVDDLGRLTAPGFLFTPSDLEVVE